jgi:hypothetical protein
VRGDTVDREVQFLTERLTPGLVGYLVLIVVALFVPIVGVIGYLAVAVFYILPINPRQLAVILRREIRDRDGRDVRR